MDDAVINITSNYGMRSQAPYVQLVWGSNVAQLTVEEARAHALRVLEAAEAAVSDAFLMEFLQEKTGADWQTAGRIMVDYREWRARKKL